MACPSDEVFVCFKAASALIKQQRLSGVRRRRLSSGQQCEGSAGPVRWAPCTIESHGSKQTGGTISSGSEQTAKKTKAATINDAPLSSGPPPPTPPPPVLSSSFSSLSYSSLQALADDTRPTGGDVAAQRLRLGDCGGPVVTAAVAARPRPSKWRSCRGKAGAPKERKT